MPLPEDISTPLCMGLNGGPPPAPGQLQLAGFMTVDEVAALRCINKFTLYHWLTKAPERLPPVIRILGRVLFRRSDVAAWLAALGRPTTTFQPTKRRGRPTKAEQARRAAHSEEGGAA